MRETAKMGKSGLTPFQKGMPASEKSHRRSNRYP
jgi:hypothetical protein